MIDYENDDYKFILDCLMNNERCDSARSLRKIITALVDYNFQECDCVDHDSIEEIERRNRAELFFFHLTTALTNGGRDAIPQKIGREND